MRKKHFLFVSLIILMGLPLQAQIQRGPAREKADYETAARFSMKKVRKMVFTTGVRPMWFKIRTCSGIPIKRHKAKAGT